MQVDVIKMIQSFVFISDKSIDFNRFNCYRIDDITWIIHFYIDDRIGNEYLSSSDRICYYH